VSIACDVAAYGLELETFGFRSWNTNMNELLLQKKHFIFFLVFFFFFFFRSSFQSFSLSTNTHVLWNVKVLLTRSSCPCLDAD
jgi:hypothetical protein